ncbi:MAG: META domain-containing protein [Candidatus Limnocylindrales bacterium]
MIRFGALVRALVGAATWIVAIGGCMAGSDDNANGGLGGTSWTVVAVGGTPTLADARPTMAFALEGVVSGTDGCNLYSGQFRTDGDVISVGELAGTLIGCEPIVDAQAQAFTLALRGAASWRLAETGSLEIRGQGDLIAEPAASALEPTGTVGSDLAGTSWALADLGGTTLVDTIPTIDFDGDGTVSGSTGCNTFNGTYTLAGATLAFGPLATTKIGCADPTMFVESAFLAGLGTVTGWSVDADGRLVLDGQRRLVFGPG